MKPKIYRVSYKHIPVTVCVSRRKFQGFTPVNFSREYVVIEVWMFDTAKIPRVLTGTYWRDKLHTPDGCNGFYFWRREIKQKMYQLLLICGFALY